MFTIVILHTLLLLNVVDSAPISSASPQNNVAQTLEENDLPFKFDMSGLLMDTDDENYPSSSHITTTEDVNNLDALMELEQNNSETKLILSMDENCIISEICSDYPNDAIRAESADLPNFDDFDMIMSYIWSMEQQDIIASAIDNITHSDEVMTLNDSTSFGSTGEAANNVDEANTNEPLFHASSEDPFTGDENYPSSSHITTTEDVNNLDALMELEQNNSETKLILSMDENCIISEICSDYPNDAIRAESADLPNFDDFDMIMSYIWSMDQQGIIASAIDNITHSDEVMTLNDSTSFGSTGEAANNVDEANTNEPLFHASSEDPFTGDENYPSSSHITTTEDVNNLDALMELEQNNSETKLILSMDENCIISEICSDYPNDAIRAESADLPNFDDFDMIMSYIWSMEQQDIIASAIDNITHSDEVMTLNDSTSFGSTGEAANNVDEANTNEPLFHASSEDPFTGDENYPSSSHITTTEDVNNLDALMELEQNNSETKLILSMDENCIISEICSDYPNDAIRAESADLPNFDDFDMIMSYIWSMDQQGIIASAIDNITHSDEVMTLNDSTSFGSTGEAANNVDEANTNEPLFHASSEDPFTGDENYPSSSHITTTEDVNNLDALMELEQNNSETKLILSMDENCIISEICSDYPNDAIRAESADLPNFDDFDMIMSYIWSMDQQGIIASAIDNITHSDEVMTLNDSTSFGSTGEYLKQSDPVPTARVADTTPLDVNRLNVVIAESYVWKKKREMLNRIRSENNAIDGPTMVTEEVMSSKSFEEAANNVDEANTNEPLFHASSEDPFTGDDVAAALAIRKMLAEKCVLKHKQKMPFIERQIRGGCCIHCGKHIGDMTQCNIRQHFFPIRYKCEICGKCIRNRYMHIKVHNNAKVRFSKINEDMQYPCVGYINTLMLRNYENANEYEKMRRRMAIANLTFGGGEPTASTSYDQPDDASALPGPSGTYCSIISFIDHADDVVAVRAIRKMMREKCALQQNYSTKIAFVKRQIYNDCCLHCGQHMGSKYLSRHHFFFQLYQCDHCKSHIRSFSRNGHAKTHIDLPESFTLMDFDKNYPCWGYMQVLTERPTKISLQRQEIIRRRMAVLRET